jgi:hypothetical protein
VAATEPEALCEALPVAPEVEALPVELAAPLVPVLPGDELLPDGELPAKPGEDVLPVPEDAVFNLGWLVTESRQCVAAETPPGEVVAPVEGWDVDWAAASNTLPPNKAVLSSIVLVIADMRATP